MMGKLFFYASKSYTFSFLSRIIHPVYIKKDCHKACRSFVAVIQVTEPIVEGRSLNSALMQSDSSRSEVTERSRSVRTCSASKPLEIAVYIDGIMRSYIYAELKT